MFVMCSHWFTTGGQKIARTKWNLVERETQLKPSASTMIGDALNGEYHEEAATKWVAAA
jgi:hypothetical protein